MSEEMSIEQELMVLRELTEAVAQRLDVLSQRVDPARRSGVRVARAEALSLADNLVDLTRPPSSHSTRG